MLFLGGDKCIGKYIWMHNWSTCHRSEYLPWLFPPGRPWSSDRWCWPCQAQSPPSASCSPSSLPGCWHPAAPAAWRPENKTKTKKADQTYNSKTTEVPTAEELGYSFEMQMTVSWHWSQTRGARVWCESWLLWLMRGHLFGADRAAQGETAPGLS